MSETPILKIRRTGTREWGWQAWSIWVETETVRYCGRFGTYAWTRCGAERKVRRLLRQYLASRPGPEIVVDSERSAR